MKAAIKLAIGLTLALVVGCDFSIGGGGEECCAYETRTSGGTVSSLEASAALPFGAMTLRYEHGDFSADRGGFAIMSKLPDSWTPPPDAGASDDGGVDLGAIGAPRGWGRRGRVALVDLGDTVKMGGSNLVNARLIWCADPYERLVGSGPSYECESGVRRPARVEELTGTYTRSDATSDLRASTESGAVVRISTSTYTTPPSTYQACTRASFSC